MNQSDFTMEKSTGQQHETRLPKPRTIEVERKFVCEEDIEEKLKSFRAVLKKESSFEDSYYDNDKYSLTKADYWLRRRETTWELKCPPRSCQKELSTQYAEFNKEPDIVQMLVPQLKLQGVDIVESASLDELLVEAGIKKFSTYKTSRKTYVLGDISIDLDLMDFGFKVGEVEIEVMKEDELDDALKRVDDLTKKLGVATDSRVPGKMSVYLHRFRPEMYAELVRCRSLCEVDANITS